MFNEMLKHPAIILIINLLWCSLHTKLNNRGAYIRETYSNFILDGFSLAIWPLFIKFVKTFLYQSFVDIQ